VDIDIKIFIVDDDILILQLYKRIFNRFGFTIVDTAQNGQEAVIKFQKFIKKPDLIIMDYHMPLKNGIEATQAILEIDKTTKIVIVSGDPSIKEKALASGAICFKEKQFNLSEISQQIYISKNLKKNHVKC